MTKPTGSEVLSDADLDRVHGGATPKLMETYSKGKVIDAASSTAPQSGGGAAQDDVIVDGRIITAENYDSR